MGGHDTQASAQRSNSTQHNDSGAGSWGNPNFSSGYNNTSLQPSSRSQSNTSPQYPSSTPASTFGRLSYSAPSQQAQNGSVNYNQQGYGQQNASQNYAHAESSDSTKHTYGGTQSHQSTAEPSRYASPLHAAQAQQQQQQQSRNQSHMRQHSQSSNHQAPPVVNSHAPLRVPDHRQASASVEPVNTTVDHSQVYDFRAEREKKAKAEAEKRRKMEEIEAAKKAEEARIAEEQRKVDEAARQAEEMKRRAEEQRVNEEKRRAEQAKRKADEKTAAVKAAVKAEAERKKEEQRKARESKSAADTLASMATSSNVQGSSHQPPAATDEEAEMRAMFQKMREFNSKNPAMLAKLWEEERRSHSAQSQSPQQPATTKIVAPSKPNPPKKAPSSTPLSGSTSTPAQLTSFRHASTTGTAPVDSAANAHAINTQPSETNIQPTAPQANAHLWPPGKKGLLAEIAARWLHGVNPERVVTTTEILKLLDLNPDYVQLCESLEATGLRFERAAFARELLRGIPAAGPANQTSPKVTEASIMSANGTVAQATGSAAPEELDPKPKRRRATKAEMEQRRSLGLANGMNKQGKGKGKQTMGMVEYEMPSFSVSDTAQPGAYVTHMSEQPMPSFDQPTEMSPHFSASNDYSRQPSLSVQPERRSVSGVQQGIPTPVGSAQPMEVVRPLSPPRQPADKEEAARKRGFADLVHLTAGDSDDDDLPPMKMMKPSQGPRPGQHDQQHMQRANQPHQPNPQSHQQHMQQASAFSRFKVSPSAAPSPGNARPPFQTPAISTNSHLYMQPNGSFGVAPTAVMRVGPTPAPAPTMKTPTISSPAPPPPKRKGPTNEQLQHERMKGRMVVEPIMRDRVARKSTYDSRTIARDILLATGRHPDMRPLNSHLNTMQKLLGDKGGMLDQSGNKSDLATIKWDILDPEPPKVTVPSERRHSSHHGVEGQNGITRSTEIDGGHAEDELSSQKPGPGSVRGSALDLRDVNANTSTNNNNPPKVPKKRGRPPRASLPNPDGFTSVNSPMQSASSRLSGTPRQTSSQPQSTPMSAPSGAVGYSAFRPVDENGNQIKKKGRPVGWRKNVHSREAQGLTPKKSASAKPKPTSLPESQLQEPKYQVYKCRWLDCDAELHSLEVLKKHVTKVHGRPDLEAGDQYHCSWQGCKLHAKHFSDISGWLSHVDMEHLHPVAWQLGDGPRGGLSGESAGDG